MVPLSQAKMQMQQDGVTAPTFDPHDTVYYMIPEDRSGSNQLTEIDMKIRATEHELGIQRCLDLLSFKAGMVQYAISLKTAAVKDRLQK